MPPIKDAPLYVSRYNRFICMHLNVEDSVLAFDRRYYETSHVIRYTSHASMNMLNFHSAWSSEPSSCAAHLFWAVLRAVVSLRCKCRRWRPVWICMRMRSDAPQILTPPRWWKLKKLWERLRGLWPVKMALSMNN